ncbi:Similar to conserved Plasmodium protein [Plasmodium falciparum 3D7]; acc. no. XP_001350695 [Pyronema omphalodes CBS 100304]|uniref:Similar to conserved Plasmodium protein [Plasmodium falciparum 3D7] acc. no. XP_001350695 n=1 Tax=Pyronema omphalodes (strain CBS 100304) TaxID=1076935 RepID=U4LNV1_PYROM|nr:Similar to conserved Plasmodium protein [Plasmodium falciparum 3D7]; acc. no. XP_001350695 [Pyronema omphalodes CBS 100304]
MAPARNVNRRNINQLPHTIKENDGNDGVALWDKVIQHHRRMVYPATALSEDIEEMIEDMRGGYGERCDGEEGYRKEDRRGERKVVEDDIEWDGLENTAVEVDSIEERNYESDNSEERNYESDNSEERNYESDNSEERNYESEKSEGKDCEEYDTGEEDECEEDGYEEDDSQEATYEEDESGDQETPQSEVGSPNDYSGCCTEDPDISESEMVSSVSFSIWHRLLTYHLQHCNPSYLAHLDKPPNSFTDISEYCDHPECISLDRKTGWEDSQRNSFESRKCTNCGIILCYTHLLSIGIITTHCEHERFCDWRSTAHNCEHRECQVWLRRYNDRRWLYPNMPLIKDTKLCMDCLRSFCGTHRKRFEEANARRKGTVVNSPSATDQGQGVSFNQIPVERPKKGKKYQSIRQVVESPEMAGGERVSPVHVNAIIKNSRKRRRLR